MAHKDSPRSALLNLSQVLTEKALALREMASTTATSSMNRQVEEPAEKNVPEGKYMSQVTECCLIAFVDILFRAERLRRGLKPLKQKLKRKREDKEDVDSDSDSILVSSILPGKVARQHELAYYRHNDY